MYIVSFDVGIKNLALCLLETNKESNHSFRIVYWNVISMIDYSKKLDIDNVSSIKPNNICSKDKCKTIARYTCKNGNNPLCMKHTKERFVILPKGISLKAIQDMDKDSILSWLITNKIKMNVSGLTSKTALCREIRNHIYIPISKTKRKTISCDQFSLIQCSYELKHILNDIHDKFPLPDHILIENQISPKASRMKSVQSMITMYYIMKGISVPNIHYISSSRKLTILPNKTHVDTNIDDGDTNKTTYDQRKSSGVNYTASILETDHSDWMETFSKHKKKDDLADCLLQGLWWLSNEKHIVLKEYKI